MDYFPISNTPCCILDLVDVREGIERRIEAKRKEIADLEVKIREQLVYIRALEDTLRLFDGGDAIEASGRGMRPDSDVGKSQVAIKTAGRPLHISELLKAIGKPDEKRNRVSLAGTLAGYARRGNVFTRTGPNKFGLIELERPQEERKTNPNESQEPPDDFGNITDDDVPF